MMLATEQALNFEPDGWLVRIGSPLRTNEMERQDA